MPTISSRRGPIIENGGAQHEVLYNQSNGRVPMRAQAGTSNEIQRNTASVSGMNGGVEDDPNAMTTRIDAALQQPTPLFERLVTEEVQELRAYVRIVENQNRRLVELERVHGDLEARLEAEAKSRQQVEATLEAREREWAEKLDHVERDRDHWKGLVEAEKTKNSKLIDQVYRKDQDIHRMLQRKVCRTVMTLKLEFNVEKCSITSLLHNPLLVSTTTKLLDRHEMPDRRQLQEPMRYVITNREIRHLRILLSKQQQSQMRRFIKVHIKYLLLLGRLRKFVIAMLNLF
jgi:hypothetical protein